MIVHLFFALKQIFLPNIFHLAIEPFLKEGISFLSTIQGGDMFRAYGLAAHPNHLAFFAFLTWIVSDFSFHKGLRKSIKIISILLIFLSFSQFFIFLILFYELWKHFSFKRVWILCLLMLMILFLRDFSWNSPSILERILNYEFAKVLLHDGPLFWKQSLNFLGDYHMKPWDYQAFHSNIIILILEFSYFGAILILGSLIFAFKKNINRMSSVLLLVFLIIPDPMILSSWNVFFLFFVAYFMFSRNFSSSK